MMKILYVKRVCYGKENTELSNREYRMHGRSAVGTVSDWKDFAKNNGADKVSFEEKDGKTWEQFVF